MVVAKISLGSLVTIRFSINNLVVENDNYRFVNVVKNLEMHNIIWPLVHLSGTQLLCKTILIPIMRQAIQTACTQISRDVKVNKHGGFISEIDIHTS